MTESEWAECQNPVTLLDFSQRHTKRKEVKRLRTSTTRWYQAETANVVFDPYLRRKLRLFACGCCRRIWHRLPEGIYRDAIVMAERYADGVASRQELQAVRQMLTPYVLPYEPATKYKIDRAVRSATESFDEEYVGRLLLRALTAAWEIGDLVSVPASMWTADEPQHGDYLAAVRSSQYLAEQRLRANLVRDVIPSPFQKVEFNPDWLHWQDKTVMHLAQSIYEEYRLDDLMILADALEEAGCAESNIIEHCRQPGPHLRGCWVVDLVLSKE